MAAHLSSPQTQTVTNQTGQEESRMRSYRNCFVAVAALLCLLPAMVGAQEFSAMKRTTNAPPKPSGTTPRAPDGHPDLTGVWNGLGDNLLGVPNQIANNGLAIEDENTTRDLHSGARIATFPRNTTRRLNSEESERAAS